MQYLTVFGFKTHLLPYWNVMSATNNVFYLRKVLFLWSFHLYKVSTVILEPCSEVQNSNFCIAVPLTIMSVNTRVTETVRDQLWFWTLLTRQYSRGCELKAEMNLPDIILYFPFLIPCVSLYNCKKPLHAFVFNYVIVHRQVDTS